MIQLVQAPPRSGKSYFVVNYLLGFTKFDGLYNEYILDDDVLIISNIEGLRIKHWTLDYCLDNQSVDEFFSTSNFESIQKKTRKQHIILAIDECHKIFPAGYKNPDVYEFFAFHGHLGIDIFLITQGIESMSRMFNPLLEYVVRCMPRSKKLGNFFVYKYQDLKGQHLYTKKIPTKKKVFAAYSSFRHDEHNKPRSAVTPLIVGVVSLFLVAGFMFYYALNTLGGSHSPDVVDDVSAPVSVPVSAPASASASVVGEASPPALASDNITLPVTASIFFKDKHKLYLLTKYGRVYDYINYDARYNTVTITKAVFDKLSQFYDDKQDDVDVASDVDVADDDVVDSPFVNQYRPLNLVVDHSKDAAELNKRRLLERINRPLRPRPI